MTTLDPRILNSFGTLRCKLCAHLADLHEWRSNVNGLPASLCAACPDGRCRFVHVESDEVFTYCGHDFDELGNCQRCEAKDWSRRW